MRKNNWFSKTVAYILVIAMVFCVIPANIYAEEAAAELGLPTPITIAAFDDIDEDILWQGYDYGVIVTQYDLLLPDVLTGTDDEDNAIIIEDIMWISTSGFDPMVSDFYTFTPLLPDTHVLGTDVTPPQISVFIRPAAPLSVSAFAAATATLGSGFLVPENRAGSTIPAGAIAINNEAELRDLFGAGSGNGYYYLTTDITLTSPWTPRATFSGTLDGQWHVISGFEVTAGIAGSVTTPYGSFSPQTWTTRDSGLIAVINGDSAIMNLGLEIPIGNSVTANGSWAVTGGLAARTSNDASLTIDNCFVIGGGEVQAIYSGSEGRTNAGGLLGWYYTTANSTVSSDLIITNSFTTVDISSIAPGPSSGSDAGAGGLVGAVSSFNNRRVHIENCYTLGNLNVAGGANANAGGIASEANAPITATFINCYSQGNITTTVRASGNYQSNSRGGDIIATTTGNGIVPPHITVENCYYYSGQTISSVIITRLGEPIDNYTLDNQTYGISLNTRALTSTADIEISGRITGDGVSQVSVYLNGTFVKNITPNGDTYSTSITLPGEGIHTVRVEITAGGAVYQAVKVVEYINSYPSLIRFDAFTNALARFNDGSAIDLLRYRSGDGIPTRDGYINTLFFQYGYPYTFALEFDTSGGQIISEVNIIYIDSNGQRVDTDPIPTVQSNGQWIAFVSQPVMNLFVTGRLDVEVFWQISGTAANSQLTAYFGAGFEPNHDEYENSALMPSVTGGITTSGVTWPNNSPNGNGNKINPNAGGVPILDTGGNPVGITVAAQNGSKTWNMTFAPQTVGNTYVFWAHGGPLSEFIFVTVENTGVYQIGTQKNGMNHLEYYGMIDSLTKSGVIGQGRYYLSLDPAGYVYEAVPSNRLAGVTATLYDQSTGAPWDASLANQQNPLITNSLGAYEWFVGEGWWQVRFTRSGYESAESIWMQVLPEHTEVNIPMVSRAAPTVERVNGYHGGIDIFFSKYMTPASLTADMFTVTQNGTVVPGRIEFRNLENTFLEFDYLNGTLLPSGFPTPTAAENVREYASVIRFVPDTAFTADSVQLIIDRSVTSYAGTAMVSDYSNTVNIALEPQTIVAALNDNGTITVSVTPAAAAAGMNMTAVSDMPFTAVTTQSAVTLNASGEAVFTVDRNLPGMATITFTLENTLLTAQAAVTVGAPVSRRLSMYPEDENEFTPDGTPIVTVAFDGSGYETEAAAGAVSTFQVSAVGNPLPTYSLTDAPAGVTINPATGLIGINGSVPTGVYNITINAANGKSGDTQIFKLTVVTVAERIAHINHANGSGNNGGNGGNNGGGGNGSNGGSGSSYEPPTPRPVVSLISVAVNDGAFNADVSVSNRTAAINLTTGVRNQIQNQSDETVSFDLSNLNGVETVTMSRADWNGFANAGLGITFTMPNGTLAFDEEAVASIGARTSGSRIAVTLAAITPQQLTAAQRNQVTANDLLFNISVVSNGQPVTNFDGTLTVTVPYNGATPVSAWVISNDGTLEQLPAVFNANNQTVSFVTTHFSVFMVGHTRAAVQPLTSDVMPVLRFVIGSTTFYNYGVPMVNEAAPFIDAATNRTMVPIRAIAEGLGATVNWDEASRTVNITRGGAFVNIAIGEQLPAGMGTAVIINGRTFVPLRYVSEILGADVVWDDENQSVYIY